MSLDRSISTGPVLVAFALSGVAALIYEVIWTRALSLVLGSTTYAVSTMLATFMAGLAIGAFFGGRLADRSSSPLFHFGLCEFGIGLTGMVSVPLIYHLPGVYLAIYEAFHLYPVIFFPLQIGLCAVVMLVPTTLMGATFPLVSRAITPRIEELGQRVGAAYSANTVGAVIGSLVAGFLLIPTLGLSGAALVAGSINVVVGLVMTVRCRPSKRVLPMISLCLFGMAGLWVGGSESAPVLGNFYTASRYSSADGGRDRWSPSEANLDVLFRAEPAEGPVVAYRSTDGHLLLQVGGKIEGTGSRDIANTLLLAYLPIAAHASPQSMLVIGLGAGVTLDAAREHIPNIDLVEINPAVIEAVARFGPREVLEGVRVFRNDARNFLATTRERYDIISSEPSYPTDSVVAHLFTVEFYRLAAERLLPDGIFCQWLPYHMMTNDDVTMMLRTFNEAFPHAMLWKVPDGLDLILLGSRQPIATDVATFRTRVEQLNISGRRLHYVLSRSAEEIVAEIAQSPGIRNTDDLPLLEFRVARAMLAGGPAVLELDDSEGSPRSGRGRHLE